MIKGLLLAIAANTLWATAFVAPLLLPEFTPVEITLGRYLVFGLSSLVALLVLLARKGCIGNGSYLRSPRAWMVAFILTALGNVTYYACLSFGLRFAGTAMPTLIIGLLPVVMAVLGTLGERDVPWGGLAGSFVLICGGLTLVQLGGSHSDADLTYAGRSYGFGIVASVAALVSWAAYGFANARYLQRRAEIDMVTWTCMIGVATLPALLPLLSVSGWDDVIGGFLSHSTDELMRFAAVSLALGIGTSWVATWAWNGASVLLPTSLLGQLIVVETLMALIFASLLRWTWPMPSVILGAGLLLGGVLLGIRLAR